MTLASALRALHGAGVPMTLASALRALHAAGRIRSVWLPGMQYATGGLCLVRPSSGPNPDADPKEPVASDPCTVGGLTALLREASGDPLLLTWTERVGDEFSTGVRWGIGLPTGVVLGATEGQALSAALVALAEALPSTDGGAR